MGDKVKRLKFIFGASTKDLQKDVNQGKAAIKEFANQGTSVIDKFGQAFGINTRAITSGLKQTQTCYFHSISLFISFGN